MLTLCMQLEGIEGTHDLHMWVIGHLQQSGPTLHEFSAGPLGEI